MSTRSKKTISENASNAGGECLDAQELSEIVDNIERDDEVVFCTTDEVEASYSNDEEENIVSKRRGQKRRRLLGSSRSETDVKSPLIETASDGTIWEEIKEDSKFEVPPVQNIFSEMYGPTGHAKRHIMKGNVKTAFSLIIDRHIMERIRACTEAEGSKVLDTKWELNAAKLDAFIALLYARGAYEAKNLDISYLWNNEWGPAFFSKTMSRNAFTEMMRFLRFDKETERNESSQYNKFALISEIWDRFIENSQSCYKPGAYISVDEQSFSSKTKCREYIPNKPDKFQIKFWLASDVSSKYIINGLPYFGKNDNINDSIPFGEFVVLKLVEPFTGCGRNVTTDEFFTSFSLASELLKKRTTLVGTIRGNKRELPEFAKKRRDNMPRFSSKLFRSNEISLTVYKSKPNQKVLLLSSLHNSLDIEESDKLIPKTIAFYNNTKSGLDINQMLRKHSVKSKSCRWSLQVFFNMLDLAGLNAWILYKEATGEQISRVEFLFQLARELAAPHQESREKENVTKPLSSDTSVRKSCQVKYCKGYKTTKVCSECRKYVCGMCTFKSRIICRKCSKTD